MQIYTAIRSDINDRRLFGVAFASFLFVALMYLYFLGATISAAVDRGVAQRSVDEMMTRLAPLESVYVERVSVIDPEFATARGFVDAPSPRYISTISDRPSAITLRGDR